MSDKSRIRRLPERAVTERATVDEILDEGIVCHAAYVIEGRPVVIPTLYVRDRDRILIHGSNSMGLARAVRAGSPLSIAVTHLDGIVVARSAFNSSANYRSVVMHGKGQILEGDEKSAAFDIIIDKLIPGRLAELRPSTELEMSQTTVIQVWLEELSAKVRSGGPEDDPEDLEEDIWAGVVPMRCVTGEPVAAAGLRDGVEVPDYLTDYRR